MEPGGQDLVSPGGEGVWRKAWSSRIVAAWLPLLALPAPPQVQLL